MGRTGHHDDDHGEEEEGKKGRRIDLSVSQVAGAGAATLAAATAASYLNVYGTIIGTAVMAVLSTLASPLLQHWFSRSGEQARQLAGRAVAQNGARVPHAPGAPVAPEPDGISETALLREVSGAADPEECDATRTMALPVLDGRAGTLTDDTPGTPSTRGGGGQRGRRGWRSMVVPAVVVFVLVMLVVLLFELFTGRSLTSWTQGGDESTAPTLLGGTTSAPEDPRGEPGTPTGTGDGTDPSAERPEEEAPATDQPTEPAPGTGAPEDGTAEEGASEEGASEAPDDDTGATTEPTEPTVPPGDGETQGPEAPDTGTGEQGGGEEAVPAPEPGTPPTG
ncbi:prolipoprotein diacylglyceryl transferase [Nocardiopsis halotolerans]|uniref:hypothetical protein n=1 Tax=Nocardiopsis halotolerans TaxID=124252 RepID=UPI0003491678|nr:hypothetical protein [Nocardiopsis halotolerans]